MWMVASGGMRPIGPLFGTARRSRAAARTARRTTLSPSRGRSRPGRPGAASVTRSGFARASATGTVDTLALAAAFLLSILSPMAAMALGFGPMNTTPAFASAIGERLALREEPVARMHRLGAGLLAGLDDLLDDQIRLRRRRRPDGHRLVRHLHVQRVAVGLRVDRHRADAELARAFDDAAGDLAAVGDQDLVEHAGKKGSASDIDVATQPTA